MDPPLQDSELSEVEWEAMLELDEALAGWLPHGSVWSEEWLWSSRLVGSISAATAATDTATIAAATTTAHEYQRWDEDDAGCGGGDGDGDEGDKDDDDLPAVSLFFCRFFSSSGEGAVKKKERSKRKGNRKKD